MSLEALSLGGCQLTDDDLQPLCSAIREGLSLYMLKVSANRLTDVFVKQLVDVLKLQTGHPLALIDISNNKVKQEGAKALGLLLRNNKKNVNLRSLNISNNCVEPAGIEALVSVLGCSSLIALQASNQQANYEEHHLENIYQILAEALGLKVAKSDDGFKSGCCTFPNLPATFQCRLSGLGGSPGELGRMMDCAAICTDFQTIKKTHLTLHHILELASSLKGKGGTPCLMSAAEWNNIVSADKDAPSWLQLSEHRDRAIYMSGLPGSVSVQKMEGFLEMEADCEVEDIYLCKDILTQRNNGFAWALLADKISVDKAVQFYQSGQSIVLGTSFIISDIKVSIDDAASSEPEAQVRKDIKDRLQKRLKEDKEHQKLINQSYYTSQKRHAYRLAHPAYADGRIW
ncbi:hypothetical protein LSH36_357g02082 [Paralvinella palmiformis]|uniref:RRM domain-containing protein n=1 Tax=Paralvinella palmiformis TaxID=53620 RepID=A0AAD9MZJ5_9ANNE|nr:hypothetical protein LSH36_357g02082 [Paralvinella palmiformis]